jgi:hypothetical protein
VRRGGYNTHFFGYSQVHTAGTATWAALIVLRATIRTKLQTLVTNATPEDTLPQRALRPARCAILATRRATLTATLNATFAPKEHKAFLNESTATAAGTAITALARQTPFARPAQQALTKTVGLKIHARTVLLARMPTKLRRGIASPANLAATGQPQPCPIARIAPQDNILFRRRRLAKTVRREPTRLLARRTASTATLAATPHPRARRIAPTARKVATARAKAASHSASGAPKARL